MRLASYGEPGRERAGFVLGDEIVDLADALAHEGVTLSPPTVRSFLELAEWRDLGQRLARSGAPSARRAPPGARLGAPVPDPRNVLVIGANTYSHVAEAEAVTKGLPPKQPMVLAKAVMATCGPTDPLVRPPETRKLDYEVELGVVIGRRVRRIAREEAHEAIAGYTVVNDVSARDVQLSEHEDNPFYRTHYLGKSFDSFCPSGPHLVTPDELPPIETLRLRTWVNDELRQDGTVGELCFPIPELVSYVSSIMTLLPGDLICSGSPAGVAFFMRPPRYLVPGDVVTCEVEPIGRLRNVVVDELGD